MKLVFNVILAVSLLSSFGAKAESILKDYYYVASDEHKDSIKKGVCIITGKVWEAYSEGPVANAVISTIDRSKRTNTDENGVFTLTISDKDSAVFFFHPKYKEIVCWSYDFKSQHLVTMNFITSEKLPDGVIEVTEKPVIYLYSDELTEVSLKADFAANIDFSYPVYNEGWKVVAGPGGSLQSGGKSYPYIFWDGKKEGVGFQWEKDQLKGFQINTDSTISFLENTLAKFGLNDRESTDFITYWGPRITQYPYTLVQFFTDDEYDHMIGGLEVDPKPESQRRLFMVFSGQEFYNEQLEVVAPEFGAFTRNGLTLLEWGGSELESMSEAISFQHK